MHTHIHDTELHALALDGHIWREGSLYGRTALPPLLAERASLLAGRLPKWAIVAGHTAGWLWTGLGKPEPWNILAPTQPAISPIARTQWKPRSARRRLPTSTVGELTALSPEATIEDLLLCPGDNDVAAAQLYTLTTAPALIEVIERVSRRASPRQLDRLRIRTHTVSQWWSNHPVVTR